MKVNRDKVFSAICGALRPINEVVSITLVGSICDRNDIRVVSDIDTVVIVDALTGDLFRKCVEVVSDLDGADLGLPGMTLYVNDTFGPLKFDTTDKVVIHLMIYDVVGHRRHVLSSPFTCLDWERSSLFFGISLRDVYPVISLSLDHFQHARRGVEDYMKDLQRGVVSYREYSFENDEVQEGRKEQLLDARLKGEYAYHIVKNLLQNYAKLVRAQNKALPWNELCAFWRETLPASSSSGLIEYFTDLFELKTKGALVFPENAPEKAGAFMETFDEDVRQLWDNAPRISWVRHAETSMNDGSFLGQGRDPEVSDLGALPLIDDTFAKVISSPALRARQTAEGLVSDAVVHVEPGLHEINYGDAEGLRYAEALSMMPELPVGWANGKDPRFPRGENSADVAKRVDTVLEQIASEGNSHVLIVSHNVTTRCMLGQLLGLPMSSWFRLPIGYVEKFDLRWISGRWVVNLTPEQRETLSDVLVDA